MATYVIVGLNADGLSNFGRRNIPEEYREAVEAQYRAFGWVHVETIPEVF